MRPLWLTLVLVLVSILAQGQGSEVTLERVKRGGKKHAGGRRGRGCGEWVLGECMPLIGSCGLGTQEMTREGTCKVQQKNKPCKIPCETLDGAPAERTFPLEATIDIDEEPPQILEDSLNVEQGPKGQRNNRRNRKWKNQDKKNQKKDKACRYQRASCGDCDISTNRKECTMTLKKGGSTCQAEKTISKRCNKNKNKQKDACKYTRPKKSGTSWTVCNSETNTKNITVTLKKGDPSTCPQTKVITRSCRTRRAKKACRYRKSNWSDCDESSNLMTRMLTLRKGNPSECSETKIIKKRCKKACKYQKGNWSPCDLDNTKTRTDHLKPGGATSCNATRTLTRQCRRNAKRCQYDFGTWGECVEDRRTRVRSLIAGGEDCQLTKQISKPCYFKDGSDRCFYGPWGDFSSCQNGVRTKIRPVIHGGDRCQRQGVKTRPC